MPQAHILRSEKGFTLIEIMIAAAMSGFIFLLAAAGMVMFSRGSAQLNRGAMQHVSLASLGSQFLAIIETSGPAIDYLHLPIRVTNDNCLNATTLPRLRIRNGDEWTCPNVDGNVAGLDGQQIEFFRDANARLEVTTVSPGNGATPVEIIGQQPMAYTQALLDGYYYVTWPLKDENSPPFMVLRNTDEDLSFNLLYCGDYAAPAETNAASACGGSATGDYARFQSNRAIADASEIEGSVFLMYNSKDPKQYVIQYVYDATGAGTIWDLHLIDMSGKLGANYEATFTQLGYPSAASVPNWGDTGGAWNTQPTAFYSFPTYFPSADVIQGAGTIPRKIAARFSTIYATDPQNRPRWIGVPLRMTAIKLIRQFNFPPGCPRTCPSTPPVGCPVCDAGGVMRNYTLVARTMQRAGALTNDTSENITIADNIFGNENRNFTVMIARKLGQSGIEVFASNQR